MKLSSTGYGLIPITEVDQNVLDRFTSDANGGLDTFLKKDAQSFHESRIGNTTCVFHIDVEGLIGYFTMSNESIRLNESEVMDLGLNITTPLSYIPAVLIGKFAVSNSLQHEGNGKNIMELAIGEILDTSGPSTARLAVVDAKNEPGIIKFYEKCGFKNSLNAQLQAAKRSGSRNRETVKMFRDVLAEI